MFGSSASLFFRHSVYLWAIQSFICSVRQPLRICLSLTLTCQSISLKSGSQTFNQAVIPWVILCSVTVSQSVILCSVSVSQSVSHFMFSHCQSVSESFMFSYCQSVSELFYVQSLSQSVSHLCSSSSVSQSVSESFMFLIICLSVSHLCFSFVCQWVILCSVSVSQWVILCSVSVSQSVSHFMFSICLSVSQSVILCSVSVCQSVSQSVILCSVSLSQSVSQLVNYLIRQKDTERNSQINKLTKLDRQKDTQTKRWFSVHQSVT